MYVCVCNAVTDEDIRRAVENGARSVRDLREELRVATQCGHCLDCAQECLDQAVIEKVELVVGAA